MLNSIVKDCSDDIKIAPTIKHTLTNATLQERVAYFTPKKDALVDINNNIINIAMEIVSILSNAPAAS
ncbi:hypothetical protein [Borrelia crocidurae]|nr:hypothetical protein [Borrelia crocidurae]